jgi:hypothetical protein
VPELILIHEEADAAGRPLFAVHRRVLSTAGQKKSALATTAPV